MREPIEGSAATLSAHLLLAERSERIAAVATLTVDLLMLAEPSERITTIATLTDCTLSGNLAEEGGGLRNFSGGVVKVGQFPFRERFSPRSLV